MSRRRPDPAVFSAREREELRALVVQAFELRDGPYLRDACEAIAGWHERLPLSRLEEAQEREGA